jgi:hypothetical protein
MSMIFAHAHPFLRAPEERDDSLNTETTNKSYINNKQELCGTFVLKEKEHPSPRPHKVFPGDT